MHFLGQADLKKTLAYRVALAAACAEPGEEVQADTLNQSQPAFTALSDAHASRVDLMLPSRVTIPYQVRLPDRCFLMAFTVKDCVTIFVSFARTHAPSCPSCMQ